MIDYLVMSLVSGHVPGTNIDISFNEYLIGMPSLLILSFGFYRRLVIASGFNAWLLKAQLLVSRYKLRFRMGQPMTVIDRKLRAL